jgi:hypothetical protein
MARVEAIKVGYQGMEGNNSSELPWKWRSSED